MFFQRGSKKGSKKELILVVFGPLFGGLFGRNIQVLDIWIPYFDSFEWSFVRTCPKGGGEGVQKDGRGPRFPDPLSKIGFLHGFGGFCETGGLENDPVFFHFFSVFGGFWISSYMCVSFDRFWTDPFKSGPKVVHFGVRGVLKKCHFWTFWSKTLPELRLNFSVKSVFLGDQPLGTPRGLLHRFGPLFGPFFRFLAVFEILVTCVWILFGFDHTGQNLFQKWRKSAVF